MLWILFHLKNAVILCVVFCQRIRRLREGCVLYCTRLGSDFACTVKTFLENDEELRPKVLEYVEKNGSITNRQCRELLGIGYDQAISLFNIMIEGGELRRVGKTAGTRYVLPKSSATTS